MNMMIMEMATVMATALVDEDNKLHDRITELEGELHFANVQIESLQVGEHDYSERCIEQESEIARLRTEIKLALESACTIGFENVKLVRELAHRKRAHQALCRFYDRLNEETLNLRAENNWLSQPLWFRILHRVAGYVR